MKNIIVFIIIIIIQLNIFAILNIGIALTEPFAYFEETNDGYLLKGIDINIIKLLSKDLDEKINIYIYSFPDLLEKGLNNMDIIIGGIHITEERKKFINFSIPYLTTGLVILKLKGSENINKFAVKRNSTGHITVKKWTEEGKNIDYIVYETNEECLNALLNKKVDGAFFDLFNAIWISKKYPVEIYGEPLTKNDIGIGVKDRNLLEKINMLIIKYRNDNLIGE
jgi:polar amino acid transport system substrate-binding protein